MKKCTRCEAIKRLDEFGRKSGAKDGKGRICKHCRNIESKLYRRRKGAEAGVIVSQPKRRDLNASSKECTKCFKKKLLTDFSIDRNCGDKRSSSCKECRRIDAGRYRSENKESVKKSESTRYRRHREKRIKESKEYRDRPEVRARARERSRARYRSDPIFIARARLHSLLWRALKASNKSKVGSTYKTMGYSPEDLKSHIENQFIDGMTWENKGQWHIDHKKPISVFIKEGETDPAIINALSNLQPLWAKDNMSKGSKWDENICK